MRSAVATAAPPRWSAADPGRPPEPVPPRSGAGPLHALAVALLLAFAGPACSPEGDAAEPADSGKPRVVCTTGMVADAARTVAGDRARVTGLMGPGVDPHIYPMSRSDQRRLQEADVVLYHGLHLEGKMHDFLRSLARKAAESDSGKVVVAVAATISKDRLIRNELFGEYPDPHVWFDLRLWRQAVETLIDALRRAVPEHAEEFARRGQAYLEELDRLDSWAREMTERLPAGRRRIVTSHDAYNYFGRAYGWDVHGLQGISTETQAGLKDIEEAVRYIRRHGIPVIFAETSVNPASVELVARRSGCRLSDEKLYSDALGSADGPAGTFAGMFRYNMEVLVRELGTEGREP